jgi:hypothetical protein
MSKTATDGLARLQNESRIPASTWRQWCNLLKMDSVEAIDVWEEICHPIMIANRKVPEIPYILQLRCQRPQLDIFEFKEEIAKVLNLITFLYTLDDECLVKGKVKSALLKLYRNVSAKMSPTEPYTAFIDRFLIEACMMVLVTKVLKGPNISLAGVLKPLVEGRGSIVQVMRLGTKSLGEEPYSDTVRECLQEHFLDPTAKISSSPTNGESSVTLRDEDDDDEEDTEVDEVDDEVDGDDEEDDDEDNEDDDDDEDEPVEVFLLKFKTALHSIYEVESGVADDADEISGEDPLLAVRLKATAVFDPLHASIPSMEEAQNIARRAELARSPRKLHKVAPAPIGAGAAGAGGGGDGGSGGGGSGGGAAGSVTAAVAAAKAASGSAKRPGDAVKPRAAPRKDGKAESRVNMDNVEEVDIDAADYVDAAEVTFNEFSERVHQVCGQLAGVEKADQSVWALFIDPAGDIDNPSQLARTVSMEGTDAFKAYAVIKMASQYLQLKNLLSISDQILKKDRNFMIEVTQMLNHVNNANKTLQPDSRQLVPLGKTLDHAAATLVRLEALRINYKFGHEHGDEYTKDSVTVYYEESLRSLTDLTDRDLLAAARQKADADTVQMLKVFQAARFVESVKRTVRDYVKELIDAGQGKSGPAVAAHTIASPIEFEDAEKTDAEPIPSEFLKPSDLGEGYDAVCAHVCTESWSYMTPVHEPEKAMDDIRAIVRELMVGATTFQPEKKRHQDKPAMAFSVVSLDKVSGNANLKDLFVRLKEDGEINFVEDYEDGSFVDLFELREYKPARIATAAKQKAEAAGTESLQTGRKYLFTLGRTNKLFGEAPADIINSCVRDENGGPKVFVTF